MVRSFSFSLTVKRPGIANIFCPYAIAVAYFRIHASLRSQMWSTKLLVLINRWWKLRDSSGKSQHPLYSKLENYPETQDKSPNTILQLLFPTLQKKVVSGLSSKGRIFFYLVNTVKKPETWLIKTKEKFLEVISTGDLKISKKSERQSIRKIRSIEISKQMKSIEV